jgi:DNA-binding ferritin-like protein
MGFFDNMKVSRPTILLVEGILGSSNEPYHALTLTMSYLRYLAMLHQTNHWTSCGDPFYGDHQLFQRLYELADGEIDKLAEKSVGLGTSNLVNLEDHLKYVLMLQQTNQRHFVIPRPDELIDSSLVAEATFLCVMKMICDSLRDNGLMTNGLDNLLAGVQDSHEGSLYLLKQRAQTTFVV